MGNISSLQTTITYDGTTPVVELDGSTGLVAAVNTFGPNGLICRNTTGHSADSVYYFFDERGNTIQRYLYNTTTTLEEHLYDGFGGRLLVPYQTETSDPYDGFGGQFGGYTDIETGLVLFGARYYDPTTGRWLNRDPIGYEGGNNLYRYCGNNPVMEADPTGLAQLIGDPNKPGRDNLPPWLGYHHAWIVISGGCTFKDKFGKVQTGTDFGFWPNGWPWGGIGDVQIGQPLVPDPFILSDGRKVWRWNGNTDFAKKLCECIRKSYNDPPEYNYGLYACGDWANNIWDCVEGKVPAPTYQNDLNSLPTIGD